MNNQQFAQAQQQAQTIKAGGAAQLQQQGAQAAAVSQAAQTQVATQQAAQDVAKAERQQQMQQIQKQEQRAEEQLRIKKSVQDKRRRFEKYSMDLSEQMSEQQRALVRKKRNTAFNNERELAEWTAMNSQTDRELSSNLREIEQASDMKIKTLDILINRFKIAEAEALKDDLTKKSREQAMRFAKKKKALQDARLREQRRARKRGGVFKAVTGAVTVVAGVALSTNPATAWAGYSMIAQGGGQFMAGREEAIS
jgi:DNA segregation ATPase FtsK/SpoIIIE-like protein